jgi:hemolysin III
VVYGFRRPNPSPQWFGFHEVFHSLTIVAFFAHYVGVSIATYSLR